jgi:hypothetical protein
MRAEIELGNHVGIVILDNMVRPLSVCKMYVQNVCQSGSMGAAD